MSKFLFVVIFFFVGVYLYTFLTPLVSAQTTPCQLTPSGQESFAEGLISAGSGVISGKVDNTTGACVVDPAAKYATYELPQNYEELKREFYERARGGTSIKVNPPSTTGVRETAITGLNSSQNQIYNFTSNFRIEDSIPETCPAGRYPTCNNPPATKTGIVFIDGSLTILNRNIVYDRGDAGLVFIVKGNVSIDPSIKRIDAVIISFGEICTFANGASCAPAPTLCAGGGAGNPVFCQLVVNGSLISLNKAAPINFKRDLRDNTIEPSELIVQQPKYLVILKDLFSSTLEIRNEY